MAYCSILLTLGDIVHATEFYVIGALPSAIIDSMSHDTEVATKFKKVGLHSDQMNLTKETSNICKLKSTLSLQISHNRKVTEIIVVKDEGA